MFLSQLNQQPVAYFSAQELTNLLSWTVEKELLTISLNARLNGKKTDDSEIKRKVIELSHKSVRSKDYEYWVAIFSLSKQFGEDSLIGFYLNTKFNKTRNSIDSYADLERFKNEDSPVDVIIRQTDGKTFEFQLKRYRDMLNVDNLFQFINDKVTHYNYPLNYLFIMQNKPNTEIGSHLFEELHKRLKLELIQRDFGRICIIFNANNTHMIFAHVYPELIIEPYRDIMKL